MNRHLLAPDFVVVAESPDRANVFTGSPALARLPSGRLIATYDLFRKGPLKEKVRDQCFVLTSDDGGASWRRRATLHLQWATPFAVGETLYLVGVEPGPRHMRIARSADSGEIWSPAAQLFPGPFHTAPTPIVARNGRIYKAWEYAAGGPAHWQSIVAVGDLARDLTDPGAWRLSNPVHYPGDPSLFDFGRHVSGPQPTFVHPTYWLEGNLVPIGDGCRVVMRVGSWGPPNVAAVLSLDESGEDLRLAFDWFLSFPGGQCKFFVLYDAPSGLYWMAANHCTDHRRDVAALLAAGFDGAPDQERRILNLYYGLDGLNWLSAGTIAMSSSLLEGYSYPSLLVADDDLLVLSRTSLGGKNQHDTNLITLHRIAGFRNLALSLATEEDRPWK